MMTRLDTIATRQRNSRLNNLVFAAFLGLAAIVGATSVRQVVETTHAANVAQR